MIRYGGASEQLLPDQEAADRPILTDASAPDGQSVAQNRYKPSEALAIKNLLPIRITQARVEVQPQRPCNLSYTARGLNIIAQLLDVDLRGGRGKPSFFKEPILIYT